MDTAATDLRTAEFVAVDVETNGLGGDDCEITEVAAVLVGGGELHDELESLVQVSRPLSRGIQRFTGITQAMVDAAPPPAEVMPRVAGMLEGRVLVAHSASFDRRALAQAFDREGLDWPDPPVLCTVAMARRLAPLARKRSLVPLASALGIEAEGAHRALVDARTCARVFCALFPKLCAGALTVADAIAMCSPRRPSRRRRPPKNGPVPRERRPDLSTLPDDPGVYVFRDERGRPLYVGKSVSVRSRARAHFCAPSGWTERAAVVDYEQTASELGALVLENRLIKRWRPTGNRALKRTEGYVYVRCRLDIPFPVLEVGDDPAPGLAINVGPVRGRAAAQELIDQLTTLFELRHCGRRMKLREWPSAYGQMGRCLSPCLGDLDPNLYRRRLDDALAPFATPGDGGERLIALIEERMAEAVAAQRYERAAVLLRRRDRMAALVDRLGGIVEATHAATRLVLARHPAKERWDAFWIVAGRVADWGELPARDELVRRTEAALARRPGGRRAVPPEEVDEIRIVHSWIAANDPPRLELAGELDPARLCAWVGAVTGDARLGPPGGGHEFMCIPPEGGIEMGLMDKITGRAKQAAGDVTGDSSLRREGKKEERKGDAKDELARAEDKADAKADEVANLERQT
jgi:DNA polymerase-3 subunit epsilon